MLSIANSRLVELLTGVFVHQFHAEMDNNCCGGQSDEQNPKEYGTYLQSRPDDMELEAIRNVIDLTKKHE